jgi:hypothetical protein
VSERDRCARALLRSCRGGLAPPRPPGRRRARALAADLPSSQRGCPHGAPRDGRSRAPLDVPLSVSVASPAKNRVRSPVRLSASTAFAPPTAT